MSASRRQARRVALVLLYQHDVTGHDLPELYAAYEGDAGSPVPPYARELVESVLEDPGRLDLLIAEHATGWTVDRIAAIERAALRIAVLELAEKTDVPASVAIDEAVRLTKRYASPEAATFVNGVLGGVARALGVGR
jgi:transcription antitermination protein NusB